MGFMLAQRYYIFLKLGFRDEILFAALIAALIGVPLGGLIALIRFGGRELVSVAKDNVRFHMSM
jgi:hypothetical protein